MATKQHKTLSLHEKEIVMGYKLCNVRDVNFSVLVGELIKEEIQRSAVNLPENKTRTS